MRELKFKDVFAMSRILNKIQMKIDVKDKSPDQVGAEMILAIGENLHLAEKEVSEFMGNMVGISAKEFAELPMSKTLDYFEEFKNLSGIKDFFKSASQLMK